MRSVAFAALLAIVGTSAALAQELDLDCTSPQDQPSTTACAVDDLGKADDELNAVYQRAMKYQADLDKDMTEINPANIGAVKALKKAERAWIEYRDAHCEAVGFANLGGTAYATFVVGCEAELTRNRTRELKQLMNESN
ncbi:MAG: urease-associated protein [Rhizobium sp.]|nr:urease-associated protein [Rhizobium sp.]